MSVPPDAIAPQASAMLGLTAGTLHAMGARP